MAFDAVLDGVSPMGHAIAAESRTELGVALARLSVRDRALVHLAHAQELSSDQIAGIFDMDQGAVRVALM